MSHPEIPEFYYDEDRGRYYKIPKQGVPLKYKKKPIDNNVEPDLKWNNALRNFMFLDHMGQRYSQRRNFDLSDLQARQAKRIADIDLTPVSPCLLTSMDDRYLGQVGSLRSGQIRTAIYYFKPEEEGGPWHMEFRPEFNLAGTEPDTVDNELVSIRAFGSYVMTTYMGNADKPPMLMLSFPYERRSGTGGLGSGYDNDEVHFEYWGKDSRQIKLHHTKTTDSVFCSDAVYNPFGICSGMYEYRGFIPYLASGGSSSICTYQRTQTELFGLRRCIPTKSDVLGIAFHVDPDDDGDNYVLLAGQRNGALIGLDSRSPENIRLAKSNRSITNIKFLSNPDSIMAGSSDYFIMSGLGDSLGLYDLRHVKSDMNSVMNPVTKFSGYHNPGYTRHVLEIREHPSSGDTILAVGSGSGASDGRGGHAHNGISMYNVWDTHGAPINKLLTKDDDSRVLSCAWANDVENQEDEVFLYTDNKKSIYFAN